MWYKFKGSALWGFALSFVPIILPNNPGMQRMQGRGTTQETDRPTKQTLLFAQPDPPKGKKDNSQPCTSHPTPRKGPCFTQTRRGLGKLWRAPAPRSSRYRHPPSQPQGSGSATSRPLCPVLTSREQPSPLFSPTPPTPKTRLRPPAPPGRGK